MTQDKRMLLLGVAGLGLAYVYQRRQQQTNAQILAALSRVDPPTTIGRGAPSDLNTFVGPIDQPIDLGAVDPALLPGAVPIDGGAPDDSGDFLLWNY